MRWKEAMFMNNKHHLDLTTSLEEIMEDRFGKYSKYIIQERALPDVRDGLKPVQRRILYAMYKDGNVYEKPTRKSAKTVGLVIGNYHPHGDSSVYDAMVRMSQSWKIREPLVDMQGNNGSIDDDPAAAMRYTEARLGQIAHLLLEDIEKDTVLFAPNFDDTEMEPTVLPAQYPNLLVNGCTGIAAGYATNIAPHNLNEVIDATIYRIQFPSCDLESIMDFIKGPDFPTGGIVQGKSGIESAFRTGKGKVVIRAKTEIVTNKMNQQIVITEIPYEVIKSNLVMKLDDIRLSKEIDGLLDVRDETDRNGLRIVIDLKKDADAQMILNYLFKNTDLQTYYNYNIVGIVNKRPKQLGLLELLDAFIEHREEVIDRRSRYDLAKKEKRCHILEGLMKAVSILDEVIQIIRHSKDKADAKIKLMQTYQFSEEQAEAIVTLRLYRLTNTDITQLRQEFALLLNEMEDLKEIIENKNVLHRVMISELKAIKANYPRPRLTAIEEEVKEIVIDKTSMIANERVMVSLSRDGYTKRVSMRSYNASSEVSTGMKDSDHIIGQAEVDTLDTMLAFTNLGNYAYLPVYQIEEAKWKEIGTHISRYVKLNNEEKFVDGCIVKDFNTYAWIITVSKKGMIKRTPMNEWVMSRNSKVSCAMNLSKGDELVKVLVAYHDDEVMAVTKEGYAVCYPILDIPSTSCKSKGVKALNLGTNDEIASATILHKTDNGVIVVTEKSQIKRIKEADITRCKRTNKGELIAKKVKSNPNVIRYVQNCLLTSELWFQDISIIKILGKDVSLMSKEATFSAAITNEPDWFMYRGLTEVKIIDIPEEVEPMPSNDDYDLLRFDIE
ncbi:MAG: DNA topoisomerase IV subunit A [Erysipelotrichaceae bacterium]|nr:DNA topoisomerase IV subunit A [Erysipelotrichaceae bacterium]